MGLKFDEWREQADRELKRRYCITFEDAGLDTSDLQDAHKSGAAPTDYVVWFGEKYDLTEFRRSPFFT